MKKRLFSKDECAPDAKTAHEWLTEKYGEHRDEQILRYVLGDEVTAIYLFDNKLIMVEFYCGYEDVSEIDMLQLFIELGHFPSAIQERIDENNNCRVLNV